MASHRFSAFCATSLAAHAALFGAFGHAPPNRSVTRAAMIAVTVEEPAEPLPTAPPVERPLATAAPRATHSHPYPVPPDHDARPHDANQVHLPVPNLAAPAAAAASEPAPVEASPNPSPPRFAMSVSNVGSISTRIGSTAAASAALAPGASNPAPVGEDGPWPEKSVTVPARLLRALSPAYPARARAEDIEADVVLAIVVSAQGRVTGARVVQSAGFGLDEAALEAVQRARFSAAQRQGRAVSVRMRWLVSFRLR